MSGGTFAGDKKAGRSVLVVLAAQTSRNLWRIDHEANVDGAPR